MWRLSGPDTLIPRPDRHVGAVVEPYGHGGMGPRVAAALTLGDPSEKILALAASARGKVNNESRQPWAGSLCPIKGFSNASTAVSFKISRMFLGLRTVIYPAPDLASAKKWWTALLGVEPYFDELFYVGYSIAGYELALMPTTGTGAGAITYWGVRDCDEALTWLLNSGARPREPVADVGDNIRTATVLDPVGTVIGIIENPHFALRDKAISTGPGM